MLGEKATLAVLQDWRCSILNTVHFSFSVPESGNGNVSTASRPIEMFARQSVDGEPFRETDNWTDEPGRLSHNLCQDSDGSPIGYPSTFRQIGI
jgi:hypothetical protein